MYWLVACELGWYFYVTVYMCREDEVTVFAKHFKPAFLCGVRYIDDSRHGAFYLRWGWLGVTQKGLISKCLSHNTGD